MSSAGLPAARKPPSVLDLACAAVLLALAALAALLPIGAPRSTTLTMDSSRVALPTGGLHARERFPDDSGTYRWSTASGWLRLPNPGGTRQIDMLLAGGPERQVDVTLRDGATQFTFAVDANMRRYAFLFPPSLFTQTELGITAPTFDEPPVGPGLPGRSLGVVVVGAGVRGNGAMAPEAAFWLAAAAAAAYLFLRVGGRGFFGAGTIAGLLLLGGIAWYAGGAWRYSVLNVAGSALAGAMLAAMGIDRIVRRGADIGAVQLLRILLALTIGMYVAGVALYVAFPGIEHVLLREDAIVEQGTAFIFLVDVLLALFLALRTGRLYFRLLMGGFVVAGVVLLLSEISFGGRLIDLPVLRLFGVPFDGFHDLIGVAVNALLAAESAVQVFAALIVLGAAGVAIALGYPQRQRWLAWLRALPKQPYTPFAVLLLLYLVLGVVLDANAWHTLFLQLMEELSDVNAALALLFLTLALALDE
jgi:hypothetical protein